MMKVEEILRVIKENDIEFIDFRFTGLNNNWHHFSYHADMVNQEILEKGITFDGSSVKGWRKVNKSDMVMVPDLATYFFDPFASHPTLVIICDVKLPGSQEGYNKDPRSIAKKTEAYLLKSKIAEKAFFGPEPEFFIFDDIKISLNPDEISVKISAEEGEYSSNKELRPGNNAYRPGRQGGYLVSQPMDMLNDMRAEMVTILKNIGLRPHLHHHEVAASQCEIGFEYDSLVASADNVQKYKYVVRNVALSYGKTASFLPKPIFNESGSGMHVHQSLWKGKETLFHGDKYANISQMALYYIGGIIKHAKALNAFTNPSSNSYKRLVPGYEAPTLLAYSACNRSASIRIPHVLNPKATRIETRFPDPLANPYLAFAAMLLAGLDGIANKIDPGEAIEENLYEMKNHQVTPISRNLREALYHLDQDREFLQKDNIFDDEMINSYIEQKDIELNSIENMPHPLEFKLYYNG